MRGSITISITRDDEKTGYTDRYAKTFYVESSGNDRYKQHDLVDDLDQALREVVYNAANLKIVKVETSGH